MENRKQSRSERKTQKRIEALKAKLLTRLARQSDRTVDEVPSFDQLGFGALFLDEAHRYKRLGFYTKKKNIKGIDTAGSEDAFSALMKCRCIQAKRGRVVLATGTPISNTMAEAWTMLRFLAPDELKRNCIDTFDSFASAFGQVIPSFELTTTGNFKAVSRFARFVNVKALSDLYRRHVDVILNDDVTEYKAGNLLPTLKNNEYTRLIIPQTPGVQVQMARIRQELKAFETLSGKDKKAASHIPLVLYGEAKKATLDIRLLNPSLPDEEGSKINTVISVICEKAKQTEHYKGTQLVFSDLFQSPAKMFQMDEEATCLTDKKASQRFNIFEDIRTKLIARGMLPTEVVIVPEEPEKRESIFEKVRKGLIRVLLGTSERMGVGVNVQERLAGIYHLDAPNRPPDFEQRNGRGIRPGNLHAVWGLPVEIFTCGVEKTLDATAYGRLAVKQKFINQLLKGEFYENEMSDIGADDEFSALSYNEMMATLSGSQYAVVLATKQLTYSRLLSQKRYFEEGVQDAVRQIAQSKKQIDKLSALLPLIGQQLEILRTHFGEGDSVEIKKLAVGETTYTTELGKHMADVMVQLHKKAARSADSFSKTSVLINDVPFTLKAYIYADFHSKEISFSYAYGEVLQGEFTKGPGFFTSLRSQLAKVGLIRQENLDKLTYYNQVITSYTQKAQARFTKGDQLRSLAAEIADLKLRLEEETNETEVEAVAYQ